MNSRYKCMQRLYVSAVVLLWLAAWSPDPCRIGCWGSLCSKFPIHDNEKRRGRWCSSLGLTLTSRLHMAVPQKKAASTMHLWKYHSAFIGRHSGPRESWRWWVLRTPRCRKPHFAPRMLNNSTVLSSCMCYTTGSLPVVLLSNRSLYSNSSCVSCWVRSCKSGPNDVHCNCCLTRLWDQTGQTEYRVLNNVPAPIGDEIHFLVENDASSRISVL